MTKEKIRERMLSNISDEYRKGQGEFFFDVVSAVAIELEGAYQEQTEILNRGFVDTATGSYLERLCSERGVFRKEATKAFGIVSLTGAAGAVLPMGSMVASDVVNFITQKLVKLDGNGKGEVKVECEVFGSVGNIPVGAIKSFPITIEGFYSATNLEPFTNGYDGESDEELRERYYIKVRTPATSGNKYHYMNWALEVPGVGGVKVFPLAYGNGTVKIVIMDSNKGIADESLLKAVWEHIESVRPIGAEITVESVEEKNMNVSVAIVYDRENYTLEQIKENIQDALKEYLKSIAFVESYVSYARIGSLLLNTEGVLDYSNLMLNGGKENIAIGEQEILILGGVAIE